MICYDVCNRDLASNTKKFNRQTFSSWLLPHYQSETLCTFFICNCILFASDEKYFSFEKLCTKPRFGNKAKSISEMAYQNANNTFLLLN